MSQFILDLFFASIFALILVLLTKIRDRTFVGNPDSFRYSYAGVAVLCLVSFLQMAGHQGLLYAIPFLSAEIYRNLVEATGIVAGVTLLLAGVSFWLPYKRSQGGRLVDDASVRAEIIQGLDQTRDVNLLLLRFLETICRNFGFQGYALFRYHSGKRKFLCTNRSGIRQEIEPALRDYTFTDDKSESAKEEIPGLFDFEFVLPIYISDKLRAMACFSGGHRGGLSESEKRVLHDAGVLLSWRLASEFYLRKGAFAALMQEFRRNLNSIFTTDTSVKKNLPELYRVCQKYLGTEYLSLAWAEGPGRDFRRYSVGINGNILQNDSPAPMPEGSLGAKVLSDNKAAMITDLGRMDDVIPEPLVCSCGQRSLLGLPIFIDNHIGAVLTLGSPRPRHFDARRRFMAGTLAELLTGSIITEQSRHQAARQTSYLESLNRINSLLEETPFPDELLSKTAEEILWTVKTTLVRIYLLDKEDGQFKTAAVKTIRAIDDRDIPENIFVERQNIDQLNALYEGRAVILTCDDDRTNSEMSILSVFQIPEIKSTLLAPILSRGILLGIIALGEMRYAGRFFYDTNIQDFCRGMARAICQGIKQYHSARTLMGISQNIPGFSDIPDIPPVTHRIAAGLAGPGKRHETDPESDNSESSLSERLSGDILKGERIPVPMGKS